MALSHLSQACPQDDSLSQDYISALFSELDNLQEFSWRMDLLIDPLSEPKSMTLAGIVHELFREMNRQFPYHQLELERPADDITQILQISNGNWLLTVLKELLRNAAEALPRHSSVQASMTLETDQSLAICVINKLETSRKPIPLDPPEAFRSTRGGHDGIGLAIVSRICHQAKAPLSFQQSNTSFEARISWTASN